MEKLGKVWSERLQFAVQDLGLTKTTEGQKLLHDIDQAIVAGNFSVARAWMIKLISGARIAAVTVGGAKVNRKLGDE